MYTARPCRKNILNKHNQTPWYDPVLLCLTLVILTCLAELERLGQFTIHLVSVYLKHRVGERFVKQILRADLSYHVGLWVRGIASALPAMYQTWTLFGNVSDQHGITGDDREAEYGVIGVRHEVWEIKPV